MKTCCVTPVYNAAMPLPARLAAALARRAPLAADPRTNAYRLINREADGSPDLAVDRYADVLVAHLYSHGRRAEPPTALLESRCGRTGAQSVYLKCRPDQASALREAQRAAMAPAE